MKRVVLIILLLLPVLCWAQKNSEAPKNLPQYKKIVVIDLPDAKIMLNALEQWKRLAIYDPEPDSDAKIGTYKELDAFIKKIRGKLKIDSVLVTAADTVKYK